MSSLADAIVLQNLRVLTRGNTLQAARCCCSAARTRTCRSCRSAGACASPRRGQRAATQYPNDVPIEELIFVPKNAQYYAAYGAVLFGLHEPADVGAYRGLDPLERVHRGRPQGAARRVGRAAAGRADEAELDAFRRAYAIPRFEPATFEPGQHVRAVIGLDGGSTSSKAVLVDEDGEHPDQGIPALEGQPDRRTRRSCSRRSRRPCTIRARRSRSSASAPPATPADVLEESLRADVNIVETVAHMMAAVQFFGDVDVICDIGGQDIKVLFMRNGDIRELPAVEPVLGRQRHAAAGDGRSVRRAGHRVRRRRVRSRASRRSSATAAPCSSTPTA